MSSFFQLLLSVDPALLRLTKIDDELYKRVKEDFPGVNFEVIVEDEIKNAESKAVRKHFHLFVKTH